MKVCEIDGCDNKYYGAQNVQWALSCVGKKVFRGEELEKPVEKASGLR